MGPLITLFWTFGDVCLGFKARVDFLLVRFPACMLFLRFISGPTPANLLTESMAAGCVPHMLHTKTVADLTAGDARDASPQAKISVFSSSFRENLVKQYVEPPPPPQGLANPTLGNPRSATEKDWWYLPDLYCVPLSLPCLIPCVGSWFLVLTWSVLCPAVVTLSHPLCRIMILSTYLICTVSRCHYPVSSLVSDHDSQYLPDLHCVPLSLPCLIPCVGSWFSVLTWSALCPAVITLSHPLCQIMILSTYRICTVSRCRYPVSSLVSDHDSQYLPDLYCVPLSLPCLIPCVGSWFLVLTWSILCPTVVTLSHPLCRIMILSTYLICTVSRCHYPVSSLVSDHDSQYLPDLHCVPLSLPCLIPCVGSWFSVLTWSALCPAVITLSHPLCQIMILSTYRICTVSRCRYPVSSLVSDHDSQYLPDLYCVPLSLPCLIPCVGSWFLVLTWSILCPTVVTLSHPLCRIMILSTYLICTVSRCRYPVAFLVSDRDSPRTTPAVLRMRFSLDQTPHERLRCDLCLRYIPLGMRDSWCNLQSIQPLVGKG